MKFASINIDIDPISCYYDIHGLKNEKPETDPIFDIALPRFLNMCMEENIKATLFVTTETINEKGWDILRKAVIDGHELANHSFSHDYRLIKNSEDYIYKDLKKNHDLILEKTGYEPVGFRAPGYNTNTKLLNVLKKLKYKYDSSLIPSFPYYAAKWFLIRLKSLRGYKSRSFIENFRDVKGSWKPNKTGNFIFEKGKGILELPITTALTVPLIGTSIIALPKIFIRILKWFSIKKYFINIELHGIDFADASDAESYLPIKNIQPDLKHESLLKISLIKETVKYYKDNGYTFLTLRDYSEKYYSK